MWKSGLWSLAVCQGISLLSYWSRCQLYWRVSISPPKNGIIHCQYCASNSWPWKKCCTSVDTSVDIYFLTIVGLYSMFSFKVCLPESSSGATTPSTLSPTATLTHRTESKWSTIPVGICRSLTLNLHSSKWMVVFAGGTRQRVEQQSECKALWVMQHFDI